jgi:predicted homoserine dehydrogenase-like protein
MIIVDEALRKRQEENNPIRVGMIGAGFMGSGVALQIIKYVPGMELVAISNRNIEKARKAYEDAGIADVTVAQKAADVETYAGRGKGVITEDPAILAEAANIEVLIEVTGAVEFGAQTALRAIDNGKHFVTMNAELDATIGPILNRKAEEKGVVFTGADGDQPGVTMNLYRFVKSIGVKPVLCGNIKGLHDPYRNPTTQEGFASKWGQNPYMVTSFADGTKISFEQAIVANATGMGVAKRGMLGPTVPAGSHVKDITDLYPQEVLLNGFGIVDYVVGAEPAPGVFVYGTHEDPRQKHYLNLYKLGEGPLYCFYTPYHLCHFEVPLTAARAVLFHDKTICPVSAPKVDVVATAKVDLKKGQILDEPGGYLTYGLCENADTAYRENLLPMGLAEGCRMLSDIPKDGVIRCSDISFPNGRLSVELRYEQNRLFPVV